MTDKYVENRKRCIACKYYGCNVCPLMADASTGCIDRCILDYDIIKAIQPRSLDEFIFHKNSIEYLQYIGKKDADNYPKKGELCLTLTAGFSSAYSGKFVQVIDEDDIQIFLTDADVGEGARKDAKYCVEKKDWYMRLFRCDQ